MKPLQLPPTIRTPRTDEVPQREDVLENIRRRENAKIVEGYTIKPNNADEETPFTFFCEINIDNSRLWKLFQAFLLEFPDQVYVIYGDKDDDPLITSVYMDKNEILTLLSPYEAELTQDGLIKFGFAFHTADEFEEVLIMPAKYLQYWGSDPEKFEKIMGSFGITRIDDLNFIDEYPLVTESLRMHYPDAVDTDDLLLQFENDFPASND